MLNTFQEKVGGKWVMRWENTRESKKFYEPQKQNI